MRKSIAWAVVCSILVVGLVACGGGGGGSTPASTTYSNASMTGTWLLHLTKDFYFVPDGNGNVSEIGWFNAPNPIGIYQVQSNGNYSYTFYDPIDGNFIVSGALSSTTAGSITSPASGSMLSVTNLAACQGTWTGSLSQTSPSASYPISVSVGSDGAITSLTGFTSSSPIGKLLCASNYSVAKIQTTQASSSYLQIGIWGQLSGATITGSYQACNNARATCYEGTVSLTKQ